MHDSPAEHQATPDERLVEMAWGKGGMPRDPVVAHSVQCRAVGVLGRLKLMLTEEERSLLRAMKPDAAANKRLRRGVRKPAR